MDGMGGKGDGRWWTWRRKERAVVKEILLLFLLLFIGSLVFQDERDSVLRG